MAIGDQAGKVAVDELVAQFPGLEQFIDAQLSKLQATLTNSLHDALSGFADGMGQVLQLGYSINGSTVVLEVDPIALPTIPAIKARLTVNMPLLPKS
jgi:hypothetical protein